jgi:hypothetical protein
MMKQHSKSMTLEEALNIVEYALEQKRLNKVQQLIFCQSWVGQSYTEIARNFDYDAGYIKDTGAKLWQLLSFSLGEKVTKHNLQAVLKHTVRQACTQCINCKKDWSAVSYSFLKAPQTDWGEAIDTSIFYGRTEELSRLNRWVVQDRCRLVALIGANGIGKTTLSVKLAEQVQHEFDYVIWRSLRYAPPIQTLLAKLIQFLSHHQESETTLPQNIGDRISCFIDYLRTSRCLIILDHFDAVMQKCQGESNDDCQGYQDLMQRIGETQHQSCVLMTSRWKPIEVAILQGDSLPVRALQLNGLDAAACQNILQMKGVSISEDGDRLIDQCNGNPLSLKIAATLMQDPLMQDSLMQDSLMQGSLMQDSLMQHSLLQNSLM